MSAGYQLYYFPGRGRAEMARWAFAVTKIDFEDVRLSVEEWAKEKACKLRKLEVSQSGFMEVEKNTAVVCMQH